MPRRTKMTPQQMAGICRSATEMIADGASQNEVAKSLDVSAANLSRWLRKYREGGVAALGDKRKINAGRPPLITANDLDEEVCHRLQRYALQSDSEILALEAFAVDPLCPPKLKGLIQGAIIDGQSKHDIPHSLRRLVRVTPQLKAKFRGEKTLEYDHGFRSRRDATQILPDGTRTELKPGDWWEADDMSSNFPFWYESIGTTAPSSKKYGVEDGRQTLICGDVRSGKFLGAQTVGRPRDAYRAEDILRFFKGLFLEFGMPRNGIRLERGIWASKSIRGNKFTTGDPASEEQANLDEEQREELFGGFQELGLEVVYSWTAMGKGHIEGSFNQLQSIMGLIGLSEMK